MQIAIARKYKSRRAYPGPVVVIAEEDKAWMDAEIKAALQGGLHLNVRAAAECCAVETVYVASAPMRHAPALINYHYK